MLTADRGARPSDSATPHQDGRSRGTSVLAVIPTLDSGSRRFMRLVDALRAAKGATPVRVIAVLNRGADIPVEHPSAWSAAAPEGVDIVRTGLNLGFAGSVNLAASLAAFTHLWLLQDDLVPDPECLNELLGALARDAGLGAVSPTRVDERGIVRARNAGGLLDARGDVAEFLPRRHVPLARYVPHPAPDFVMSRGLLVRAQTWSDVGGMDSRFYPVGWSDVDLCVRIRRAGWRIASVGRATVLHEKGASTTTLLKAVTNDRNRSLLREKLDGRTARPEVHPGIPRVELETIAQAASSLALDLSRRTTPRSLLRLLMIKARMTVRRVTRSGRRPSPES